MLHPEFSPELTNLLDALPPAPVIPIEMGSLYADSAIPWIADPPDVHLLALSGHPMDDAYLYNLSNRPDRPNQPGDLEAVFSAAPHRHDNAPSASSLDASIKVLLYLSNRMTPRSGLQTALEFGREIYGTMAPPWDQKPGVFNQHDTAALSRLRRDLPATSERLDHYLKIHNVLDEFADSSGPWVLFNLDAEVRDAALSPFPRLQAFWRELATGLDAQTVVRDGMGHRWMLSGFHYGHITLTFILRRGMIAPMDVNLKPDGPPIPIEQVKGGHWSVESSGSIRRFGMSFGLSKIRFLTTYRNSGGALRFDNRMDGVPILVAPPVIHRLSVLLAGQFLDTLARGSDGRGASASFSAVPGLRGGTMLDMSVGAELRNAPALALFARMAAAFAPDYGEQARQEQRRLASEFFDAFESDYRRRRPALLRTSAGQKLPEVAVPGAKP